MKRLLYKLHLSPPTAIMALFDSTVSKLLWLILLKRNCVRLFVAFSSLSFLVSFFCIIFCYFLFSRIETVMFHGWQLKLPTRDRITEVERRSTRLHCLENSLLKGLWTCRNTDRGRMIHINICHEIGYWVTGLQNKQAHVEFSFPSEVV